MALGRQVVNLIGFYFLHDAHEIAGITKIAIVQNKTPLTGVGILIEMIDAVSIEQRSSSFEAVHLITFLEEEFREIRAVLSGNTGNQSFFHNIHFYYNGLCAAIRKYGGADKASKSW